MWKRKNPRRLPQLVKSRGQRIAERVAPLRHSPYIFFHGEQIGEDDETKNEPPPAAAEAPSSSPKREASPYGGLEEDEDIFTHGSIKQLLVDVQRRRELFAHRQEHPAFSEPSSPNLKTIRSVLLRIAHSEDGAAPYFKRDEFIGVLRDTLGIMSDPLLQAFWTELDQRNSGVISFSAFFGLLEAFTNGPHSEETCKACFAVFDTDDRRVLTLKRIRSLRACKPHEMTGTSGVTFPMIKALLDMWHHSPEIDPNDVIQTMKVEQFQHIWESDDQIVAGFFEEIIRQILRIQFNHMRSEFVPK